MTATPAPHLDLRPAGPEDVAFIFATWLRAYRRNSAFAERIGDPVFFRFHHAIVHRILERAQVVIATPHGEPGVILGYAVTEGPHRELLHFVYVKGPFRRQRIATALLAGLPEVIEYTHHTRDARHLVRSTWSYNPYLI